jgi:hypothetical protein
LEAAPNARFFKYLAFVKLLRHCGVKGLTEAQHPHQAAVRAGAAGITPAYPAKTGIGKALPTAALAAHEAPLQRIKSRHQGGRSPETEHLQEALQGRRSPFTGVSGNASDLLEA